MLITRPTLPPKEGYVEIENDVGERVYEKLPEQLEKEALQQELAETKAQLAQSDEAALDLYEAQAAQAQISTQQDEAIIDLYKKIGG